MVWVVTLMLAGVALCIGAPLVVAAYDEAKKDHYEISAAVCLTSAVWACLVTIVYLWSRP